MPKIVRYGGIQFADEAVKIRDLGPATKPRPRQVAPMEETAMPEYAGAEIEGDLDEMEGAVEQTEPGTEDDGEAADVPAEVRAAEMGVADAVVSPSAGVVTNEIIQSAMAEAGRILEEAVRKGEEAKNEALAGVEAEAQQLRVRAEEVGRREGFDSAVETVREVASEVEGAIARFEGERAGFEAEYEEQLKWLAVEIASKVLAKKVSENDAEMTEMVQKAVQGVKNEEWVRIEVSQEMTALIDRLTQLYDNAANITVSPVPVEMGTVHIETQSGVVDASLRTQLANLKDYFATSS